MDSEKGGRVIWRELHQGNPETDQAGGLIHPQHGDRVCKVNVSLRHRLCVGTFLSCLLLLQHGEDRLPSTLDEGGQPQAGGALDVFHLFVLQSFLLLPTHPEQAASNFSWIKIFPLLASKRWRALSPSSCSSYLLSLDFHLEVVLATLAAGLQAVRLPKGLHEGLVPDGGHVEQVEGDNVQANHPKQLAASAGGRFGCDLSLLPSSGC